MWWLPVPCAAQEKPVTLKIWNLHPKPIVRGTLNGKNAYFLLDTGSDINVLHRGGEKRYNFRIQKNNFEWASNYRLSTVNGLQRDLFKVHAVQMELEGTNISCDFHALDIHSIVGAVRKGTGIHIAGIIGSGTMKDYFFVIDYEMEQVMLKFPKYSKIRFR
jgi:RIO-like serine/threonine protein kinase